MGDVTGKLDFTGNLGGGEGERYKEMTVRQCMQNSLTVKVFMFKYHLPLKIIIDSHIQELLLYLEKSAKFVVDRSEHIC